MYKISQFSKISGLTVKALRYYDHENILEPTLRKEGNQYRYYNDDDLKTAQLIKFLRSLDFSIMEIKEVLGTVNTDEDLAFILQEKIDIIEKNISKEKEVIQKLQSCITSIDTFQKNNDYDIDIITVDEILVAAIRFTGKYCDLENYVPLLYKSVKNNKSGYHFNCYYDEECMEAADIELCLPVKNFIDDNSSVTCKKLPKIKALRTIHHGSYDNLFLAYRALFEYVNAKGIEVLTPSREIYMKGPSMIFKGNPANYITEILLPFEIVEKENQ